MVSFWAIMKSNTFHVKQLWLLFGQLLGIFGLLLILTFGHSDPPPLSCYELHDTLKPTAPFGPLKLKKPLQVVAKGAQMLEAPITGGLEALKKGQMSVFMAGEKDLAEMVNALP